MLLMSIQSYNETFISDMRETHTLSRKLKERYPLSLELTIGDNVDQKEVKDT